MDDERIRLQAVGPAMPGYLELLHGCYSSLLRAFHECEDCGLEKSARVLQDNVYVNRHDVLLLAAGTLGWTLLRRLLTSRLFQPLSHWCDLQPKDAAKMPESAWKLLFYTTSWLYTVYLLFFTKYSFFQEPASAFYGWKRGMEVPMDIAILYLIQGSFYAHSIYATLYMDAWRKDSLVMLLHHVITLTLIVFSYVFRYHNIGILVIFLHDVNDIQLEFTKLNVYFKNRGGTYHALNNFVSNVGCVSFSISWFWFRLYWFPLKVLYTTCISSLQSVPNIPFYFFFNILLSALTLMNLYWFLYIVLFVIKVLTGQMKEVNDLREYDVEYQERKSLHKKGGDSWKEGKHLRNGIVKQKPL
ncbi:ceramide synthase 1 [Erpetoichthys calabaricus]|uniref:ceramide synthase 1 n=1 Tax=Erpetoichthys calabaricus TaxID=27687 RepID=UPI002233ED07|nr:ceramide synthase 1 [Erpetoichthys calabaricus]